MLPYVVTVLLAALLAPPAQATPYRARFQGTIATASYHQDQATTTRTTHVFHYDQGRPTWVRIDSWMEGYALYSYPDQGEGYTVSYYRKWGIAEDAEAPPATGGSLLKTETYGAHGLSRVDYQGWFADEAGTLHRPGEWLTQEYDEEGRLTARRWRQGSAGGTPTHQWLYTYDGQRTIISQQERDGDQWQTTATVVREHDDQGRILDEERYQGDKDKDAPLVEWATYQDDGDHRVVTYHRSTAGDKDDKDDPVSRIETYNRNHDLVERTEYDEDGHATTTTYQPEPIPGNDLVTHPELLSVRFDVLLDFQRQGEAIPFGADCGTDPAACLVDNTIWAAYAGGDALEQLEEGQPDPTGEIRAYHLAGGPYGNTILTRSQDDLLRIDLDFDLADLTPWSLSLPLEATARFSHQVWDGDHDFSTLTGTLRLTSYTPANPVPEPTTLALLLPGLAILARHRPRRY